MERTERFDSADQAIKIGFWANAILMVMKLLAGHFGHSTAVFADGLESAADLFVIFCAMIAVRIGRKPFDEDHPYGHGRAESISAIVVSFVIFGTGAWILVRAIRTIIDGTFQTPGFIAVIAAIITILAKESLFRYTSAVGARLESPAVAAVAKDHRKDAVSSVATLIGVTGAFFGVAVMDPLAAGITALFIFHIGYDTFLSAAHDLMDGSPPEGFVDTVTRIACGVEGVEGVHEIKARRSGQYVIVDMKLDMDPEMTVKRSHAVATEVKRLIFDRIPNIGDVMIHINPYDETHEDMIRL